ncbi:hypothetical protein FC682_23075 [Peribacillus simplex]|uniref:hypothetical protein n=1 Tax=Peribacillus simplex TaxID=1478 RepID=UPI0010BF2A33|nr:hypothetical protein [Peribacillus simplex]TKH01449.1 hypothetical protein FC682_23075 [Peribacillus simplex]
MSKTISKHVWKFLSNELTFEQKKDMIKVKNIQIGRLQTQLLTSEAKWKMAISMFDSELLQPKVQHSMVSYIVESIVPQVQKDMDENATHFVALKEMDLTKLEEATIERGQLYVIIALIVTDQVDKVNQLIIEITKTKEKLSENAVSENELCENQKKITDLTEELDKLKSSEKQLKRTHKTLEKKYNDMLDRKNREIKALEKKQLELEAKNKNITSKSKVLAEEHQSHLESYEILEKENEKLTNEFNDIKERFKDLEYELQQTLLEQDDDNKGLLEDLVVNNSPKNKKKKILVFGDIPITIQKQPYYEVSFFDGDFQNYNFDDNYDEHWYIEDKLTPKEKRQLTRNKNSESIQWKKTTYNKTLNI